MNESGYTVEAGQRFERRTFAIVALLMILFPPTYGTSEHGDMYFRGYDFITELSRSYYFVEWSRLGLQFAALGLSWFFYKEITSISSKDEENTGSISEEETTSISGKEEENISSTCKKKTVTYEEAQIPSWLKKLYRP